MRRPALEFARHCMELGLSIEMEISGKAFADWYYVGLGGLWLSNALNSALPPQRLRPDTSPEHRDPFSHTAGRRQLNMQVSQWLLKWWGRCDAWRNPIQVSQLSSVILDQAVNFCVPQISFRAAPPRPKGPVRCEGSAVAHRLCREEAWEAGAGCWRRTKLQHALMLCYWQMGCVEITDVLQDSSSLLHALAI